MLAVDGDTALSFATMHGHAEVLGLLENTAPIQ